MVNPEDYAKLFKANPTYVEVKAYMYCRLF